MTEQTKQPIVPIEVLEVTSGDSFKLYRLEEGVYVVNGVVGEIDPTGDGGTLESSYLTGMELGKCLAFVRRGGKEIEHILTMPAQTGEIRDVVILMRREQPSSQLKI